MRNTVCYLNLQFFSWRFPLDIRVISSLTPEDEARYATALVKIISAVLESAPASFAVHVQLADGSVVQHHEAPHDAASHGPASASPRALVNASTRR
jgi:hypothetical protein